MNREEPGAPWVVFDAYGGFELTDPQLAEILGGALSPPELWDSAVNGACGNRQCLNGQCDNGNCFRLNNGCVNGVCA